MCKLGIFDIKEIQMKAEHGNKGAMKMIELKMTWKGGKNIKEKATRNKDNVKLWTALELYHIGWKS